MACFCPDTPPESVKSRGTRGQRDAQMLAKQDNPNIFALGLKDACCEEPCCCILSGLGAPFGCTACWARKAVLERYSTNGLDDYVCCQGYISNICCCNPSTWCAGSRLGLACEGLCCPVFSLKPSTRTVVAWRATVLHTQPTNLTSPHLTTPRTSCTPHRGSHISPSVVATDWLW